MAHSPEDSYDFNLGELEFTRTDDFGSRVAQIGAFVAAAGGVAVGTDYLSISNLYELGHLNLDTPGLVGLGAIAVGVMWHWAVNKAWNKRQNR